MEDHWKEQNGNIFWYYYLDSDSPCEAVANPAPFDGKRKWCFGKTQNLNSNRDKTLHFQSQQEKISE